MATVVLREAAVCSLVQAFAKFDDENSRFIEIAEVVKIMSRSAGTGVFAEAGVGRESDVMQSSP